MRRDGAAGFSVDRGRSSRGSFLPPVQRAAPGSLNADVLLLRVRDSDRRNSPWQRTPRRGPGGGRVSPKTRMIEVRENVLKQNDVIARALRQRFHEAGVFVVSLVSSPGAGKTALLEKTLTLLQPQSRVAALVGDLATENDAERLARSRAPVKQIITGTVCHLEASMIAWALDGWAVGPLE